MRTFRFSNLRTFINQLEESCTGKSKKEQLPPFIKFFKVMKNELDFCYLDLVSTTKIEQDQIDKDDAKLLSPDEAAKILGISKPTLSNWRSTKRYEIPFVKIGQLVKYRQCDIMRFIDERMVMDDK